MYRQLSLQSWSLDALAKEDWRSEFIVLVNGYAHLGGGVEYSDERPSNTSPTIRGGGGEKRDSGQLVVLHDGSRGGSS